MCSTWQVARSCVGPFDCGGSLTVTRVSALASPNTTESLRDAPVVRLLVGLSCSWPRLLAQAPEQRQLPRLDPDQRPSATLPQHAVPLRRQDTTSRRCRGTYSSQVERRRRPEITTCGPRLRLREDRLVRLLPAVDGQRAGADHRTSTRSSGSIPLQPGPTALPRHGRAGSATTIHTPTTVEEISFPVTGGRAYSLQIGGYAGRVPYDPANADVRDHSSFRFNYDPDDDHDGVLDNADQCQQPRAAAMPNGCTTPRTDARSRRDPTRTRRTATPVRREDPPGCARGARQQRLRRELRQALEPVPENSSSAPVSDTASPARRASSSRTSRSGTSQLAPR